MAEYLLIEHDGMSSGAHTHSIRVRRKCSEEFVSKNKAARSVRIEYRKVRINCHSSLLTVVGILQWRTS